jgi:ubiquinone/menaquinone biosynthesis C-methylase UbiE
MFKQFFQRLKFKAMARQLRKPGGVLGNKVGQMMNKANEFLYDATIAEMAITESGSILEIGFGNGLFFDKLFANKNNITVAGIDYSALMVEAAKKINADKIAAGKLTLHHGNSDKLPFDDSTFDKVFCINVIYFWDKPYLHLAEIKRVLKPGGKFFATIRTKESMQQMPFTKYGFTTYTESEWATTLEANSLKFISVKAIEEPQVDFEGKPFRISSLCITAQKE